MLASYECNSRATAFLVAIKRWRVLSCSALLTNEAAAMYLFHTPLCYQSITQSLSFLPQKTIWRTKRSVLLQIRSSADLDNPRSHPARHHNIENKLRPMVSSIACPSHCLVEKGASNRELGTLCFVRFDPQQTDSATLSYYHPILYIHIHSKPLITVSASHAKSPRSAAYIRHMEPRLLVVCMQHQPPLTKKQ